MAVTKVICLNCYKDFKLADGGFARLTQVYKIKNVSLNQENQTRIQGSRASTKL